MAIAKKIRLYVSESTGTNKVSKYFRIPLPSDTMEVNRTNNRFKGLVRMYAKVSADMFYMGMVLKPAKDATRLNNDYDDALSQMLTPVIPEKLMNDGEGLIQLGSIYEHGRGYDKTNFLGDLNASTFDEGNEASLYGYANKKKNNVFTVSIKSDSENDLSTFVPSNWEEFDTLDQVLADINTWGNTPAESRGPLFFGYEKEDFLNAGAYGLLDACSTLNVEDGTFTDKTNIIPDVIVVPPFNGSGEITVTAPNAAPYTTVRAIPYKYTVGYDFENSVVQEYTFTDGVATIPFNSANADNYDRLVLAVSHDIIGNFTVNSIKN